MDFLLDRIAVLGTGITGTAVIAKLAEMGFLPVDPEVADVLVVSPGIPPEQYPQCPGIVMSEIEFAYQLMQREPEPPRLIAVTGTNGKSTVTAMIAHILSIPFAGNVGIPLIEWVGRDAPVIVVEVSSYQLEQVIDFRPDVAIITNITPDHLERHKTMGRYAEAKTGVFRTQTSDQTLVVLAGDSWIETIIRTARPQIRSLSAKDELTLAVADHSRAVQVEGKGLGLIGAHNHLNAAMAIAAVMPFGMSVPDALARLTDYVPLPHRMEWVTTVNGRSFFDDSKATNPDSTLVAVDAFDQPVHLILGGKDKGLELEAFMRSLFSTVATITVYGEIADRVMSVARAENCPIPISKVVTLDDATRRAFDGSASGDVILLSPACSSFDQFRDFNHRGDHFKAYVRTQIA